MIWLIIHQHDDSRNYVKAERINHSLDDRQWIYYGGMDDDLQPHGLGALYIDGVYKKGGVWEHSFLDSSNKLSKEEYDKRVNEIVNVK